MLQANAFFNMSRQTSDGLVDDNRIRRSGEGEIPLALPLIRQRRVGHFYFGDLPQRWVSFQLALTMSHASDSHSGAASA